MRPVHIGHISKEVCKNAGAPDSLRASDAHSQTHCKRHATPDAQIGSNLRPVLGVWCSTLTMLDTDSTPDAQAQRPMPAVRASGECFSVRNTPVTSLNFPPAQ